MFQEPIVIPFLSNFELYLTRVAPDGDCFFHAVLAGYSKSYNQNPQLRGSKARGLRVDIANFLKSEIVTENSDNKLIYHHLAGGNLPSFGQVDHDYTLESMYNWIISKRFVGTEMVEITSLYTNINIFIIDINDMDLIIHGKLEDWYDPKRTNIVLFYSCVLLTTGKDIGGHFDLCKVKHIDGTAVSHLKPSHSFIQAIIDRYNYRTIHKI